MKTLSWINVTLGLWLIAAAFVFSTGREQVIAAESVAGVAIAVLAYASAVARPVSLLSWSVAAAGVWLIIISYGATTLRGRNATIVGIAVVIVAITNAVYRHRHALHRPGA
ncbi:MAG TPA: SPW repeat protein [Vicinamibacterales bacterium]|jgi:hypothetical protein|nr:SPW repeat protein [Vicinamibacterales bacterium]